MTLREYITALCYQNETTVYAECEQLAEALGISSSTVTHWVYRDQTPGPKWVSKLMALDKAISYEELLKVDRSKGEK